MKAWCIWCELGSQKPKNGMVWIHEECFMELYTLHSEIEMVKKYLKGEMPRILANGDHQGYETVEKFLVAMDDFDRRWKNSMELIKKISQKQKK